MFLRARKPHAGPMLLVTAGLRYANADAGRAPFLPGKTASRAAAHRKHTRLCTAFSVSKKGKRSFPGPKRFVDSASWSTPCAQQESARDGVEGCNWLIGWLRSKDRWLTHLCEVRSVYADNSEGKECYVQQFPIVAVRCHVAYNDFEIRTFAVSLLPSDWLSTFTWAPWRQTARISPDIGQLTVCSLTRTGFWTDDDVFSEPVLVLICMAHGMWLR